MKRNRYDALVALLTGHAHARYGRGILDGWSAECGISKSTLSRRIRRPQDISLGELVQMARPLEIDAETLGTAMPL